MKNKLSKNHQTLLYKQIFLVILGLAAYLLIGGLIFFAALIIYQSDSYQFWDPVYQIAQFVKLLIIPLTIIYLFSGLFVLLYHTMRKPYLQMEEQMEELMDAAKRVYSHEELLPELSPELKEFSLQLTEIKLRLQQNARAAKEAEQRKNDLVVYLAHDLKTPLTSIIGYLSLLQELQNISPELSLSCSGKEKEISQELQAKYLNIALDKSLRLEDLINEFFDITRFNLTTLTLEPSHIDFAMMLQQLRYEFQPMLSEKSLTLSLSCPSTLMYTCDPDKMQRVLDNLIRNAINYSYENTTINLDVRTSEHTLYLDITNHGRTIIPEKLSRIFEQFYRIDSSRSTRSGGSGLGLAIAKEIIELHHGTITAESQDEMIRFHIELPLVP